jgi:hypothetical protein
MCFTLSTAGRHATWRSRAGGEAANEQAFSGVLCCAGAAMIVGQLAANQQSISCWRAPTSDPILEAAHDVHVLVCGQVAHIALHKHLPRAQPQQLVGGHTGVGAPNPAAQAGRQIASLCEAEGWRGEEGARPGSPRAQPPPSGTHHSHSGFWASTRLVKKPGVPSTMD